MYKFIWIVFCLIGYTIMGNAQNFSISMDPITVEEIGGLQSYAIGQHEGKWLILGGRLDGLHRRQPWASFDIQGHNNQIYVVDPKEKEVWKTNLNSLPQKLQEQLSSTNPFFYQEEEHLIYIGGYGYSKTADDHLTYPYLSVIDVPQLIDAIISRQDINPYFRQLEDENFRITGGKLKKIKEVFYLLGGQNFAGRYNPMGPDHGPGFIQEYSNSVRRFSLEIQTDTLLINHFPAFTDKELLHRRDYNAEAQILPDGSQGITMFSGVFQYNVDWPWLNSVEVTSDTFLVNPGFEQLFNHYHCPTIPIYDASKGEMHTLFFGGIAQYYLENEILVQDDNVPFVKTISCVTRKKDGTMEEKVFPIEMPAFLGAGAEFIINPELPQYDNHVIDLEKTKGKILLGHIYGGIESSAENIFFTNEGDESMASNTIYAIYLTKEDEIIPVNPFNNLASKSTKVYTNPDRGGIFLEFTLTVAGKVKIDVTDTQGKIIQSRLFSHLPVGSHTMEVEVDELNWGSSYVLRLKTDNVSIIRKIKIQE